MEGVCACGVIRVGDVDGGWRCGWRVGVLVDWVIMVQGVDGIGVMDGVGVLVDWGMLMAVGGVDGIGFGGGWVCLWIE